MEKKTTLDSLIVSLKGSLYEALVIALSAIVESLGGKISCKFLYRYIDSDAEQDIYRIKELFLQNGILFYRYDSYNGETNAADVQADYDEDFENEDTVAFMDVVKVTTFDIDFISDIYNYIKRVLNETC